MADNVRIPVDVDTRKARADLQQLNRDKGTAKKRVSSAARRTARMATRAFAFTGAAAVVSKFQNNSSNGNVSVFDEALTPFYAMAQQYVDKELGYSSKARTSAREQTRAAFAYTVGRTGETAGMTDFFNVASRIRQDVESGRNLIRQDPRFLGPDLETATKAAVRGNFAVFLKNFQAAKGTQVITQGFDYIVAGLKAD